ncbi:hypothetical protein NV63_18640, partial [Elizabethkingia anophelis]
LGDDLPPLFYSDAQRVRQIIINLLSNAFKFTTNGSVTLEIRLSEEDIEFSQAIHSSGQDLLALINDILDLSKVEAGKLNIEVEAINLTEIPEAMLQSFSHLSRKKEIPLHIQLGDDLPPLFYSDAQRVRQIIINLLSNAFKFTTNGSVTLEIRL